jgi:hypothetical protein
MTLISIRAAYQVGTRLIANLNSLILLSDISVALLMDDVLVGDFS